MDSSIHEPYTLVASSRWDALFDAPAGTKGVKVLAASYGVRDGEMLSNREVGLGIKYVEEGEDVREARVSSIFPSCLLSPRNIKLTSCSLSFFFSSSGLGSGVNWRSRTRTTTRRLRRELERRSNFLGTKGCGSSRLLGRTTTMKMPESTSLCSK